MYGYGGLTMDALPALLNRSGFAVDVISTNKRIKKIRDAHQLIVVNTLDDVIQAVMNKSEIGYDLYIPADDPTLRAIKNSNISVKDKLKLLPIIEEKNIHHIYSKIGLAKVFHDAYICSPRFIIAYNKKQLQSSFYTLGFPLMVKIDSSSGGTGTYQCNNEFDLQILPEFQYPVLIQEKIEGNEIDLSAFYQQGKLIHFSYSEILSQVNNKFGPSSLRRYKTRSSLNRGITDVLSEIGLALGANGFVNIGCIQKKSDKKLYFIESDMRPTVWVEYSKYFRDDPACYIKKYFESGEFLTHDSFNIKMKNEEIILPYLPRLDIFSIIINRYNCHNFYENYARRNILIDKVLYDPLLTWIHNAVKPKVPSKIWDFLKKTYQFINKSFY